MKIADAFLATKREKFIRIGIFHLSGTPLSFVTDCSR